MFEGSCSPLTRDFLGWGGGFLWVFLFVLVWLVLFICLCV